MQGLWNTIPFRTLIPQMAPSRAVGTHLQRGYLLLELLQLHLQESVLDSDTASRAAESRRWAQLRRLALGVANVHRALHEGYEMCSALYASITEGK